MCIFKNIIEKNKIFVGTGKTANGVFFKKSGVTDESCYVTMIKNSQRIVLFDKVQYEFGVNNIASVVPANGGTYNVTASVSKKTHGDGTVENNISFSPTSFTVPANTGASYNSSVTITQSGSNLTQNCEYTVEADSVTSLTLTLNTPSTIPAAGGTVSSTTYTLKAYYKSGRVDNNVTTGTLNWTAVTAASKGTVISNETTAGTLYASATFGGKTATANTYVKQQANYVTAIAASGSSSAAHFSYSNIAAGATSASPTLHGGGEYTFTSGSKKFDPSTSPSFGGTATYTRSNYTLASSQNGFTAVNSSNGTLTATSLGTTISNNRTSAAVTGKLVITYTHASSYSGGGTVTSPAYSSTATCTQTGNYVTAITVTTNPAITIAQFAAAGGSKTDSGTNGAVTYKFSSGSQTATAPGSTYGALTTSASYTMTSGTGFYLTNATSGTISAQTKGTTVTGATTSNTITKSVTYTWTPTASYNSQGTKTTSANTTGNATQAANAITSYVTPAITTKSYAAHDASSGTSSPTVKGSCYPVYTSTATGAQVTNITLTVTSATMTAGNGATINTSNGVVTWAANTTTTFGSPAAARTTNTITLKVSFGSSYSNLGASGTTTATQNADAIASTVISDLSSNTYTAATSPAPLSGTTITITGGKATVTYVSGAKFYPTATLSASTTTYSTLTGLTLSTTANTSATTQFTATSPNFGVYHANASYWTVTSTYEGVTKSLRLYYPANAVTGSSAVNTVAYTQIPASGGTSTPPLNAIFYLHYSSGSKRTMKITDSGWSGLLAESWGTVTSSITYTMTAGNGFTMYNTGNGAVSAATKGTVLSNVASSNTITSVVNFNWVWASNRQYLNSGSTTAAATGTTKVTQAANYITSIQASGGNSNGTHFAYANIAPGATSAPMAGARGGIYTFTSGGVSPLWYSTNVSSWGSVSTVDTFTLASSQNGFTAVDATSGTLTATSLGTTISNARTSAKVTGSYYLIFTPNSTYSGNGTITSSTYTSTGTCTQNGNYVTAITVSTNPVVSISQFPASGGSKTDAGRIGAVRYRYTSGSYDTTVPAATYGALTTAAAYTMTNGNGFFLTNATNGTVSAQTKGTTVTGATTSNTITKTVTYTWTPTSGYNAAGTKTVTYATTGVTTQAANAITSYVTPAITTKSYANHNASSGTSSPTVKGSCYPVYTSTATGAQVTNITLTVTAATMTAGNGATINTSNGVVTWAANTTTTFGSPAAARTTNTITLKVSFGSTYSNLGASGTTTATQNADAVSSTVISNLSANTYTASTAPCPASGGTVTLTGGKATVTYVSGAKFYPTTTLSGGTGSTWSSRSITLSTTENTSSTTQFTGTLVTEGQSHVTPGYYTVSSTYSGVTKTINVYYAGNPVTGCSLTNTVAYTQIPASGGSSTPPLNATFSWLYASGSRRNWKLGNAISLAETWGTMTTSVTYTMTNGNGFTLKSSSTGEVSAATKGTTVTGVTSSNTVTCVVNCSWVWASNRQYMNSGSTTATTSGTTKATQAANAVTSTAYGTPTISSPSAGASIGTIAAKGGTVSPTKTASQTITYGFTSTATSSKTNSTFTWTTTMTNGNGFYLTNATNGTISAATKGTTVSNATTSNTATIYAWANSKTGSTTYKAMQAANAVTSAWTATAQTAQGTASGTPTYGITTSTNSKTVQGGSDGTLNITATGKKYTPTCNTWKVASTPVSAYTSTAQKSGTTTTGSTVYSGTVTSSETSVAASLQSAPDWVNTAITGYYYKKNYTTAQRQGNLVFKVNENAATTKSVTITQTAGNPQTQPLAFNVISGYRINFSPFSSSSVMPPISYRINNGNWTAMVSGTPYVNVSNGDMVYFEGPSSGITNISTSSSKGYGFRVDGGDDFEVMGNIMSLLGGNWTSNYTITEKYAFCGLFRNSMNITSAENLVLPATGLTDSCYSEMFEYCTYLTTAPSILPATTLAKYCYRYMFMECTSLTTAPALPATTLGSNCYSSMFRACRSLVTAPALPATVLVDSCYYSMFIDCTSLTTAPALSATTLVKYCYQSMFYGCTRLNYIKCLATNISASNCTSTWVSGVASSGTFVKNANMSSWTTGNNGIPSGWTVQNA